MTHRLRRRTARMSAATILFLLLAVFAGGAPASADAKPCVGICEGEVSTRTVDVSKGPVDVTFRLKLTDNPSQEIPWLGLVPEHVRVDYTGFDMELVEGTQRNGTWEVTTTFDRNSIAGSWVAGIYIDDPDGESDDYYYVDLDRLKVTGSVKDAQGGPGIIVVPSDISYAAWYFEPVYWMLASGITTGYKDGTFKPSKPVTRGEAVTFLYRYADEDFTVPTQATLTDVPVTHNFFESISWATKNGVVNGYKGNVFRPGQNMTRGEVAAILYRQADPDFTVPATTKFSDVVKGQTGHYEAIAWLTAEEITSGRKNGTFDPKANVTRAEFATFLQRYWMLSY